VLSAVEFKIELLCCGALSLSDSPKKPAPQLTEVRVVGPALMQMHLVLRDPLVEVGLVEIDSYRFLDYASRQVMKAWAARQKPGVIPFTPLAKPLSECTVSLVSTAGVARNDDRPFDQEGERRNPWWGDPSFRTIPLGTTEKDVRLYHLHIDPRFGESDLDVVLPMRRLAELSREGVVGRPAPTHYSLMGYILEPTELLEKTVPALVERMRAESVDAAALVPA
jgi:D-proline reductase (dithiol) PrdB